MCVINMDGLDIEMYLHVCHVVRLVLEVVLPDLGRFVCAFGGIGALTSLLFGLFSRLAYFLLRVIGRQAGSRDTRWR